MKLRIYEQSLKVFPILLLAFITWANTLKAQGVDAVFVLDNSNSIEPSEWTNISSSTKQLMDKVLACNPYNRIAVVHYALNLSGYKSNLYIESEFTNNATIAKNFVRRSSLLGLNTGTHQALGIVNDIISGISNPNVLSTRKILTPLSSNKLVIFLFTDGTNNDAVKIPAYEGPGGLFDNYNNLKTSKGATFVVLQGFSDAYAGEEPAKQSAAAIASVGGTYTGIVQSNPGDPQGSGVTPRKMVYSPTFNVSSINISTLAEGICKSCAPLVQISAVTPPAQSVCLNGIAQPLVASATGVGTLNYQWYSNTTNSITGSTPIAGATGTVYSPPTNIPGVNYYYVTVSDSYCEGKTTSSIVSVSVSNTTCLTCPSTAPVLNNTVEYSVINNSTYTIPCGSTTANLSALTAYSTPSGSILTWHTDPIATSANRTNPANAVAGTGKYYAAFYNASGNCYSPTKMVTVAAPICAVDDNYSITPITAGVGGTLPSIFGNDTYNGNIISTLPVNSVDFFYELWNTSYATIDANGNLIISASTPPGSYTFYYKICDKDPDITTGSSCSMASVTFFVSNSCYKPAATLTGGTGLISKVGISSLNRPSITTDNWPAVRKGGWLVLESRTKGFVPNRLAFDLSGNPVGIAPANFVEGMMVYDTTNKCLKVYTSTDEGNTFSWKCMTTQTCPD